MLSRQGERWWREPSSCLATGSTRRAQRPLLHRVGKYDDDDDVNWFFLFPFAGSGKTRQITLLTQTTRWSSTPPWIWTTSLPSSTWASPRRSSRDWWVLHTPSVYPHQTWDFLEVPSAQILYFQKVWIQKCLTNVGGWISMDSEVFN